MSIALIGTVCILSFVGCNKKNENVVSPIPKFSYDNTNLKTILRLSGKKNYDRVYGHATSKDQNGGPIVEILIEKGIYVGGQAFDSNCKDYDAICQIVVTTTYPPKSGILDSTVTGTSATGIPVYNASDSLSLSFNVLGQGTLIQAQPDSVVSIDVQSVNVTPMSGGTAVNYVPFQ